ncbi:MAG TPA: hypothetical protein VMY99_03010 [Nevskiaceae bacterium]|nr:hypothetical protein [Nevskiaceae bacterium]
MHETSGDFFRKHLTILWVGLGALALVIAVWLLWFNRVDTNAERVFWGVVQNSLSSQSVTVQAHQQSKQGNMDQYIQLGFGPDKVAHSLTNLTQGTAMVKTENISTPKGDYTRYLTLQAAQKGKDGKPVDTSKIVGVWANTTAQSDSKDKQVPQLFSQVLLQLSMPVGNLPVAQRNDLLHEMRTGQVYTTSFTKLKRQHKDGRLQYIYDVQLQPILYVRLMKDYAKAMGLHSLDAVDPNKYSGSRPVTVHWTVDVHARQLVGVDYGNGHQETYSGWGLAMHTPTPAKTISAAELQKRLSVLQ